ncbi:hypothetical protein IH970_13690 [candidate division KSB1 bacterium]|nr:hypothetical protein [candidate division KSB1 bacterium]
MCKFLEIKEFCPKPVLPNSSFKKFHKAEDFNNRWKSWPETKRARFKKHAGPQLIEWGYAESNSW